ncbi:MAG: FixH family protein [Kiloniellaceae bacterium]
MSGQKKVREIRGKHVLLAMIGMFGIIIAVNAVFVVLALDTFTGLTTENPYKEGLAYNKVLAARDAQRDLGWQGTVRTDTAGGEDSITVMLSDKAGDPLGGLELAGTLRRPIHAGEDQPLNWQEASPGHYRAVVALPERGNWDLVVTAHDRGNPPLDHPPFEMKARLWFE